MRLWTVVARFADEFDPAAITGTLDALGGVLFRDGGAWAAAITIAAGSRAAAQAAVVAQLPPPHLADVRVNPPGEPVMRAASDVRSRTPIERTTPRV